MPYIGVTRSLIGRYVPDICVTRSLIGCCLLSVKIWTVVDLLKEVDTSRKNHVDRFLSERILSHIMRLNSICSDKMGVLHTRIHPFKSV